MTFTSKIFVSHLKCVGDKCAYNPEKAIRVTFKPKGVKVKKLKGSRLFFLYVWNKVSFADSHSRKYNSPISLTYY